MRIIRLGLFPEYEDDEKLASLFTSTDALMHKHCFICPNTVTHYFPKSALVSIISSRSFFFSDVEFLNDSNERNVLFAELEHAMSSEMYVNERVHAMFSRIIKARQLMVNDIVFEDDSPEKIDNGFIYNNRLYLFCCSLNDDCLSNWKYYGKGNGYEGFNLSLDTNSYVLNLKKALENVRACKLLHGAVVYRESIRREMVETIISNLNSLFDSEYHKLNDDRYIRAIESRIFYYIQSMSIFHKDQHYIDEQEYRFVVEIDNTEIKPQNLNYDFRFALNTIIPYLKIPFEPDSVRQLGMPPANFDVELLGKGVAALLNYHNFNNCTVAQSEISLRY